MQNVEAMEKRIRRKIAEEEVIKKQKDTLQIDRSYTPNKLRPYELLEAKDKKFASVHEYLYNNATERKTEKIVKERTATQMSYKVSFTKRKGKSHWSPL